MSMTANVVPPSTQTNRYKILVMVAVFLLLAIIACTTQRKSSITPTPFRTNTPVSNVAPAILILEPLNGDSLELFKQTEIRVLIDHPIGATQILLIVNGTLEKSKALPIRTLVGDGTPVATPEAFISQTKFETVLEWTPITQGTVNIKIVTYFEELESNIAELNVEVSPPRAIDSDSVAEVGDSTTATGTDCAIRVSISNLIVRDGPGEDYESLGYYDRGEFLRVLERAYDSIDREWFYVQRPNGNQAWVVNNPILVEYQSDDCLPLNLTP